MRTEAEVFLCIRPKDTEADSSTVHKSLRALDEALTEAISGGAGDHDHERAVPRCG